MKDLIRRYGDTFVVFFVAWVWIHQLGPTTSFYSFQGRDIERAMGVLQGRPIFFGPEASGGGNLPGGFYYLLLAVGLKLGGGWRGCLAMMHILGALSVAFTWSYFKIRFNRPVALLASFCLVGAPLFYATLSYFNNPSFLFLAMVVVMAALAESFATVSAGRKYWWWAACLILGLSIQVHFMAFFLMLAAVTLQLSAGFLRLQRLSWKVFASGLLLLGLTLAPFAAWKLAAEFGVTLGQPAPEFIGVLEAGDQPVPQSLKRFLGRSIQMKSWIAWLSIHTAVALPALALGLLLLLWSDLRKWNLNRAPGFHRGSFLVWKVCLIFAAIPSFGLILHFSRTRYLILFSLCVPFALAGWLYPYFERLGKKRSYLFTALAALLTMLYPAFWPAFRGLPFDPMWPWLLSVLATAMVWRGGRVAMALPLVLVFALFVGTSAQVNARNHVRRANSISAFENISRQIFLDTGWNFEQAKRRMFFVKFHYQSTPAVIYREFERKLGAQVRPVSPAPDGYFVFYLRELQDRRLTKENFRSWTATQPLPVMVRRGLYEGLLQLGEPQFFDMVVLAPYFVPDSDKFPRHFHNYGIQYGDGTSEAEDEAPLTGWHKELRLNDCPGTEKFCEIKFTVQKFSRDSWNRLQIRLSGAVISMPNHWINPDWSQYLTEPYVKIQCGEKLAPVEIILLESIGYGRLGRHDPKKNNFILGPFERTIRNPCGSKEPLKISAGYKSADVLDRRRERRLEGREVE